MADTTSDTKAAIDAGIASADLDQRIGHIGIGPDDDYGVPIGLLPQGMQLRVLEDVIAAVDNRAANPRQLRGTSVHQELASFIAHCNAFKDSSSAVFADTASVKLTAIYDYNQPSRAMTSEAPASVAMPRWGKHRAVYACPLSREWQLWLASNEKQMSQEQFCEFLEDNAVDLANPTEEERALFPLPAAVLEMTRSLSIKIVGECTKKINPTTGEVSLVYRDEHGPESTKIPRAFLLGIPVFDAGERWRVEARLRFTLQNNTKPLFSYSLYQHEDVKRRAFGEVRAQVEKGTGLVLFAGTPEQ